MYPTTWYNGDNFTASELNRVRQYLQLVQGARLWLVRVSNNSCNELQAAGAAFRTRFVPPTNQTCFGALTKYSIETRPFGPPGDPTKYRFTSGLPSHLSGKAGWGQDDYGNGGYIVYLPNDGIRAAEVRQGAAERRGGASPHPRPHTPTSADH